ncbi:MAG TPA: tetratricopeptide repeat protein [Opitutaceae bacterium]|jgi:predicted O-linked N-acetylglucosamine transferase (SPINDLY family)|nr:tetratricopeptide repeat protein [Opitutaceae bacterium]
MSPTQIRKMLEKAVDFHTAGHLDEADELYTKVCRADPGNFDAPHLSGMIAIQKGQYEEAAALLKKALRLNPASAQCEMRLGVALAALADYQKALTHLEAAVARSPDMPEGWCHLGVVQKALGRTAPARASLERAVSLCPNFVEALDNLGALISSSAGFDAAVPILRQLVVLQPSSALAIANLGVALAQSGHQDEALGYLDRAVQIDPSLSLAHNGRALVLQETYRIPEAVEAYRTALVHNPLNLEARSGRLLALHYLEGVSREAVLAEHLDYGKAVPPPRALRPANLPDAERRIRVGFLSADLRTHSVAYFLEPLLAGLDPSQFEIVLYHDHARVDGMSTKLRSRSALWRHVAGMPHDALEALVRADAPDILVDLAGHTGINRLPVFARRVAPVQVSYLGYPDTTGLAEMDYRFVDQVTDPFGVADPFHTEELVRFAPTAWCYAPPGCAPEPVRSEDAPDHITFGCFNNFSKVGDETLRCWAEILSAVPRSRLLLKGHGLNSTLIAARLKERLAASGLEEHRVELAGRTPNLAAHLALYGMVDVALDTFPYNGTTTTCEALWMGVPIVTMTGDRHGSRVGASLLSAIGHPEWIAGDVADYVRAAANLGRDPALRTTSRSILREQMRSSPLMDQPGQAARFGAALRQTWASWCSRNRHLGESRHPIPLNTESAAPIGSQTHDFSALSA